MIFNNAFSPWSTPALFCSRATAEVDASGSSAGRFSRDEAVEQHFPRLLCFFRLIFFITFFFITLIFLTPIFIHIFSIFVCHKLGEQGHCLLWSLDQGKRTVLHWRQMLTDRITRDSVSHRQPRPHEWGTDAELCVSSPGLRVTDASLSRCSILCKYRGIACTTLQALSQIIPTIVRAGVLVSCLCAECHNTIKK